MLTCMRTTIDINDEVLRQAKRRAADETVPLREIVERALRAFLGGKSGASTRYALRWRTERGRLQAGVCLEDRDALFDIMDGRR